MTEQQVELIVQRPNQADRRLVLGTGVTHLGRAEDNELVLADIGVSRRHARVTFDGSTVLVEDMGSGNGTYFRGQRLDRQVLQDGDQIYIDPFTLVFRITRRAAPARPQTSDPTPRLSPPPPVTTTPAPPAIAPAQLITLAGHRLNPTYNLRDGTLTLGRSEGRDITLYDPSTSRLQTSITWRDGAWWAVDEKSANGTWVNGDRINEHRLVHGDIVRLGSTEFRFESQVAPAPQVPATATYLRGEVPRTPESSKPIDRMFLEPTRLNQPAPPLPPEPAALTTGLTPLPAPVDTRPTPTPPPARPGAARGRLLVPLALFSFAGLSLIIAAGAFWFALHPPGQAEVALTPTSAAASPTAARPPEVERLVAEGQALLDQRKLIEALARFSQAHKLAPDDEDVQRRIYLACTLRTVDALAASLATPAPAPGGR